MYDLHGGGPSGSVKCLEPNWEELYEQKKTELDAIRILINALVEFVDKIKPNINRDSPIATFLGTLSLDVRQREAYLKIISKNITDA